MSEHEDPTGLQAWSVRLDGNVVVRLDKLDAAALNVAAIGTHVRVATAELARLCDEEAALAKKKQAAIEVLRRVEDEAEMALRELQRVVRR